MSAQKSLNFDKFLTFPHFFIKKTSLRFYDERFYVKRRLENSPVLYLLSKKKTVSPLFLKLLSSY